MQEALHRSQAAGYKDYECVAIKDPDKVFIDSILWHFLGIHEGWKEHEWKIRRKMYFDWIDQGLEPDLYFEKILNRKLSHEETKEVLQTV